MEDRESQARRTVKKYMGFSVVVGLFASSRRRWRMWPGRLWVG